MPAEGWALIGTAEAALESSLCKGVAESGLRTTRLSQEDDLVALLRRRVFVASFFDSATWRRVSAAKHLPSHTYRVLAVSDRDESRALALLERGEIHDWINGSADPRRMRSLLQHARSHSKQVSELEAVRSVVTRATQDDAALLLAGAWPKDVEPWIARHRNDDAPLLIAGEAGTGKELLGRLLHCRSGRAAAPFVSISCHGKPLLDLEREIFGEIPPRTLPDGYVVERSRLALAANGTVFFDRAEELPRRTQLRLAQALRTKRYSPAGGGDTLALKAQFIFAVQERVGGPNPFKGLQRDLIRQIQGRTFRIAPLREHPNDFPNVVQAVFEKVRRDYGQRPAGVTERAMEAVVRYAWPGNLREFEAVFFAASVMAGAERISLRTIAPILANGGERVAEEEQALEEIVEQRLVALFRRFGVDHLKDLYATVIDRVEKPLLTLVLKETKGNQVRAARVLGINRNTLRRKLTQYGIRSA